MGFCQFWDLCYLTEVKCFKWKNAGNSIGSWTEMFTLEFKYLLTDYYCNLSQASSLPTVYPSVKL